MNNYRYILEPYKGMSSRYRCQHCQHKDKTFTRYIDTETGQHINNSVGRCERLNSCGVHYTPKQYFQDKNILIDKPNYNLRLKPKIIEVKPTFIEPELLKASLSNYNANNFIIYLNNLFGHKITNELISKYFIGTSDYWQNSTVFWQIDTKGKIRTGKIMLYNATTGKRTSFIQWIHSSLKLENFNLKQCLFGLHLLNLKGNENKTIALCESEKTAIIASVYFPQFIWLACGQLQGLTIEKCKVLEGRKIILYPDLKALDKWSSKAKELSHIAKFTVSNLLERKSTDAEKEEGYDIVDYLVKFDLATFLNPEPIADEPTIIEPKTIEPPLIKPPTKTDWNNEIMELEAYFENKTLPTVPIKLSQCQTITNVNLFIDTHLKALKSNNGKPTFEPYLNRLQQLKQLI